ncbi:MAG: MFS transporter [Planctomycetes bacterium]|nr:MFS transporter [Planctomycetota bacterium]
MPGTNANASARPGGPIAVARTRPRGQRAGLPSLDRQLRWLSAYAFVTYPFACVPFLFLYFRQHGLDQHGYGLVIAAYYVAMFAAELPTGVLADRFGPKVMLALGPLLLAAGFGTLLAAPGFAGFVAGEILLGLGHAVLSGPPATMLYETLRAHGLQHRFLAEEARVNRNRLLGTGLSFLLGGALARLGGERGDAYDLAIFATCAGNLAATAIALQLAPGPGRPALDPRGFLAQAARDLSLPPVRWLLGYWIVLFALLRFPFHDYQPYLLAAAAQEPAFGDPLLVGLLFALLNLAAAPLSGRVPQLVRRCGRPALFWAMPLVLAASLGVMGAERAAADAGHGSRALAWLGVAMFFVQQVPFGMHTALVQEFVNHRIGSAARTTVMSALSLAARLVYAGLNVLLFAAQDRWGLARTLGWAGVAGALLTVAAMALRPAGTLRRARRAGP